MTSLDAILLQSNPPLRQRRQRTNFNEEALNSLEVAFAKNPYPDINERETMARELKTTEDRVQVWFQNKRARYRKRIQKDSKSDEQSLSIQEDSTAIVKEAAPVKPVKPKTKTETPKTPIVSGNQPTLASTEISLAANYSPVMPSSKMSATSRQFLDSYYVNSPNSDSGFASFLSQQSPTAVASTSPHMWTNYANLQHHLHSYLAGLGSPVSPTSTAYNEVFADTRTFASSSPYIYNLAGISNQTAGGSALPEKKTRVAKSVFRPYE